MKDDTTPPDCLVVDSDSLRPYDIICGRCRTAFNNVGNRRFRVTISLNLRRYMEAPTRREKSAVMQSVVDVLLRHAGARFLKKKKKRIDYLVLDAKQVRQKIQHALRDMAAFKLFDDDIDETMEQDDDRVREDGKNVEGDGDVSSLMEYSPFLVEDRMLISTTEESLSLKSKPEAIGEFVHMSAVFEDREGSDHFLNKGESFIFFL
jgi:hypothetical protein